MELKKGDIVMAWDDDKESHCLGYYLRWDDDNNTRRYLVCASSTLSFGTCFKHVEKLQVFPPLPEGVKIGDECRFYDDDGDNRWAETLVAVASNGLFLDSGGVVWDHCEPIKKKKVLKKASEIVKWFDDRGGVFSYVCNEWYIEDGARFPVSCFQYCGKEVSKSTMPIMHPDWIEEVG